jgi:signal transduction histidine kinase
MKTTLDRLARLPGPVLIILGLICVFCLGLIDYFTGREIMVSAFFLLPIAVCTWLTGRNGGLLICVVSTITWLVTNRPVESSPETDLVIVWNAGMLLLFFLMVVYLLMALKSIQEHLEEMVEQRTAALRAENAERQRVEEELKQANVELGRGKAELQKALDALQTSHAELQATQWQLTEVAKMESVGRMAAGVAHEVKNPLAIIVMGIGHLKSLPLAQDESAALTLADLQEAVTRADTVVSELLGFSAPRELELQVQDPNQIIEKALALVHHQLTTAGVDVVKMLEPKLPTLWLDGNKMEQAFVNLLTNAIQSMPQGGTLYVRTRVAASAGNEEATGRTETTSPAAKSGVQMVVVEIEDTGSGIPVENLSKVFDPFFITKSAGKGTGLGLSVAQRIVQLHRGRIVADNRQQGGARFAVFLQA